MKSTLSDEGLWTVSPSFASYRMKVATVRSGGSEARGREGRSADWDVLGKPFGSDFRHSPVGSGNRCQGDLGVLHTTLAWPPNLHQGGNGYPGGGTLTPTHDVTREVRHPDTHP